MNRVLLQVWETSDRMSGTSRDGCSLHVDELSLKEFVSTHNVNRESSVPDEYTRSLGLPVEAFVDDLIYSKVLDAGSVRVTETSLTNLLNLAEIIVRY